ncbi:TIGR02594 family protein [Candidatus Thiothrix sp. Deng01]|uniref:TIGR02594 family protein n=1 Tax=Candidatus Thiothrix phosphatis TaxID=3112415 RepID=A0ABU6D0T6_9GAMM|nr:TIGR02594 family protein [Candidatus Thiothrix sp. Deng01]MEB4591994.1 TIGR02594 family protein [Candidatus Thiothrix sp. Deng01]
MVTDKDFKRLEGKVDAIGHSVASANAAAKAAANMLRPELPVYFALPMAAIAYLMIVNPLRTAGTEISPYVERAYHHVNYAGETAGSWLARLNVEMPNMLSGQAIRGLSNRQTAELMAALRQRENSGRYDGWNTYGYVGAYQAGAAALTQTGYIKREAFDKAEECIQKGTCGKKQLAFIQNESNWTTGHSYAEFMASPMEQDAFFIALANFNVEGGFKRGMLRADDPKRTAGFIAASHLKGTGAAGDWYLHHDDDEDANGAKVSAYAALGENAISIDSGVIQTATRFIGMREDENRQELATFIKQAGLSINPDSTAWCAGFTNAVLHANGIKGTDALNARSFLEWGEATNNPQPGDVVVLYLGSRDGWQGHVGFFAGFDSAGNVRILGGNQGDKVSIESFPKSRVLGYRKAPSRKIFS